MRARLIILLFSFSLLAGCYNCHLEESDYCYIMHGCHNPNPYQKHNERAPCCCPCNNYFHCIDNVCYDG